MTFQEFKNQVRQWYTDAEEFGYFVEDKALNGRMLYSYHSVNGSAVYDSFDCPNNWTIDNGRGTFGHGRTWYEADKDEKQQYDAGFHLVN